MTGKNMDTTLETLRKLSKLCLEKGLSPNTILEIHEPLRGKPLQEQGKIAQKLIAEVEKMY